jgi:hypothetical protein
MAITTYTAGEVLTAASLNNNFASGGLQLVKTQVIGSAVGSVTVTGAFSSTYDNYKIVISGGVGSAAGSNIGLQLGATTTGYYWSGIYRQYTNTTVTADKAENGSSWNYAGRSTTTSINLSVDLFGPNLAKNTNAIMFNTGAGVADYFFMTGGYLADTTQYTAFTLTPNTGTLTGGTIRVYGLANS